MTSALETSTVEGLTTEKPLPHVSKLHRHTVVFAATMRSGRFIRWWCAVSCLLFLLTSGSAQAQICSNCTSNDISIKTVELVDAQGNPLTSSCTPGTPLTAYLKVNVDVNASERYGFYITGDVTTNGVKTGFVEQCIDRVFFSGVQSITIAQPVSYTCGTNITLSNVFTAWSSRQSQNVGVSVCSYYKNPDGSLNCTDITPKCYYYTTPIEIISPLIANYTYKASCPAGNVSQAVSFTSTTAGGKSPYNYTWNFGDGSTTTTTSATVTHTYTSPGSFTATLTATDASSPIRTDAQAYSLTITAPPTVIADNKQVCSGNNTVALTGSPAGGTWSGTGVSGSVFNATGLAVGNYLVTYTYSAPMSANTSTSMQCPYSATATVAVIAPATVSLTNDGPLTCTKNTATLTATTNGTLVSVTGPNNYSATSAPFIVTSPGTYTLTATNGVCNSTATTTVSQQTTPPSVSLVADRTTLTCAASTATLTASGGGTYRWNTGATTASISVSVAGAYSVTVTGSNGCTATNGITILHKGFSATLVQGSCNSNQTNANTADDTFHILILAEVAAGGAGGASGSYEVVINANPDGTGGTAFGSPVKSTYGQSVTGVGAANGTQTYSLTVRDFDNKTCHTQLTTTAVAPCSSCDSVLCPIVSVRRL